MDRNHADPNWYWQATFTDGATFTFMADSKALAADHAAMVGRDNGNRTVRTVVRIGHRSGMTPQDWAHLGTIIKNRVQLGTVVRG